MGGCWTEGFETHQQAVQWDRKYASRSGSWGLATAGRVFGQAGTIAACVFVTPSLPNGLQDIMGVAFGVRFASQVAGVNSGAQGFYFERGAGNEQCHLEFVCNAGSFEVRVMRGATQLGITTQTFAYASWHHFELKVTIHPSAGAYELRHNTVNVLSGSSVNTAATGSSQADVFAMRFSTTSANAAFDDIAVWDGSGARNNDFLGDVEIKGMNPNGAGASTAWTNDAGTGSNWQNVDDDGSQAPDETGAGGTNSSDTSGQKDLYTYTDLSNVQGAILFVQVDTQMAMAAAGSRDVKSKYRDDGGTEADIATHSVSSTLYDSFNAVLDENPATSTSWDVTDLNDGQFGVEVV